MAKRSDDDGLIKLIIFCMALAVVFAILREYGLIILSSIITAYFLVIALQFEATRLSKKIVTFFGVLGCLFFSYTFIYDLAFTFFDQEITGFVNYFIKPALSTAKVYSRLYKEIHFHSLVGGSVIAIVFNLVSKNFLWHGPQTYISKLRVVFYPLSFLMNAFLSKSFGKIKFLRGDRERAFVGLAVLAAGFLGIYYIYPSYGLRGSYANPWLSGAVFYGFISLYLAVDNDARGSSGKAKEHIVDWADKHLLNVGLFKDRRRQRLFLDWKDINHHIHILGQPGSGKSVLLRNIYAHQIETGSGLMMVDLKADLDVAQEMIALSEKAGRIEDLLMFNIQEPDMSVGYNPLLRGTASELKDKIVGALEWSEAYYKKVSEEFLLDVFRGLVILRDKLELIPTLEDLHECITHPESLEALANRLPEEDYDIKDDLRDLVKSLKKEEVKKGLSGLRADLAAIIKSDFGELVTKRASVDLMDVVLNKKIFYILLDGQNYPIQSLRLGRLLLADIRSISGKIVTSISKNERPQFTVVVDEFADLVSSKESGRLFTGFLNRCRGSGIGVIIAHQSLGDFEDGQVMKQVLDSTETLFSFVQKDPESCELLASIAGTMDTWEKTKQIETPWFTESETGLGSKKLVQEFIYHPNVFKNLNVGQAVYIAKKPSRHGVILIKHLEIDKSYITEKSIEALSRFQGEVTNLLKLKAGRKSRFQVKDIQNVEPVAETIPEPHLDDLM